MDAVAEKSRITKRTYTALDDDSAPFSYVFSQVYAIRPSQLRWDIITAGARVGYRGRSRGFKQRISTAAIAAAVAPLLFKPRNINSLLFIVTNALRYRRRIKDGTLSLAEAERGLVSVATLNDPRRGQRALLVVTDWASLAADIDTKKELTATESRVTPP